MADKARFNPEEVDRYGAQVVAACNVITEQIANLKKAGEPLNEVIGGTEGIALNDSLRDSSKLLEPVEEKFGTIKKDVTQLFNNEQAALEIARKTIEEIKQRMADLRKALS